MLLNKIFILAVGFLMTLGISHYFIVRTFKNNLRQAVNLNIIISLTYALFYGFIIFVVEGEGAGTGLEQGFSPALLAILPLFLYFFILGFMFTALPASLILNSIIDKKNLKKKPASKKLKSKK